MSTRQVQAVKDIYSRPHDSKGHAISPRGIFPGAELQWKNAFSDTWGDEFFKDTALLSTAGKEWNYTDFDFDSDYKRSGIGVLYADTDPDLRRFRDAGGKLLSYQGDTDMTEMPGAAFDYYETVEKTMGGLKATEDFYRLFRDSRHESLRGRRRRIRLRLSELSGGMGRTRGGTRCHDRVASSWSSPAPAGTPLDPATVIFTRPVYPYPLHAKYKGTGDRNDAANFVPVE